jgi:predicted nucleic acid-binding protein
VSGLVVDASAALKLVRGEPGRAEVRRHFHQWTLSGDPILVPPLFWMEIVNVLALRYRFPPKAIVEAIYELEQVGIATAEVGRPAVLAIIDAVARSGLTAYDASYLVLAESADASLLTADAQLASAAGDRAILLGSAGDIAEAPVTYVADPSWVTWKGAVAYLGELRSTADRPSDRAAVTAARRR